MYDSYNVSMAAKDKVGTIDIYGVIGGFFSDVSAESFRKDLTSLGDLNTLEVHIHSPGGSVFDGLAMFDALTSHTAKVVTYVDGLAASMASILMLAGDERHISENGWVMIHNPTSFPSGGTAEELEKAAEHNRRLRAQMMKIYQKRTSLTSGEITKMMNDETWFDAEEVVKHGFANVIDESDEPLDVAACGAGDISWQKAPDKFKEVVMRAFQPRPAPRSEPAPVVEPESSLEDEETPTDLPTEEEMRDITLELLQTEHSALVAEISTNATAAERERVKQILDLSVPGCEDLVAEMAFDGTTTVAEASQRILKEIKDKGLAVFAQAELESNDDVPPSTPEETQPDTSMSFDDRVEAAWEANKGVLEQAFVTGKDAYVAYCRRTKTIPTK